MFQIVNISDSAAPWMDTDGKPMAFATGKEAADYCASQNRYFDWLGAPKLQPRRIADDGSWQERERGRFADGSYLPLPWVDLPWFTRPETALHFAHISTEDGAKIAYTDDAVKGQSDRQTRIKPGKYLARFYADVLSTEEIARLSAEYSKAYETNELRFASTADDWERVYTDGPSSCMSYAAHRYSSPSHPVRVYAGPDLQLAYLEREGRITARAIVWPSKNLFSRIYGDETRLADLLDDAGYKKGSLRGARLIRKETDNGFVMPYVDYISSASDDGEFIVLDDGGDITTDNTNGLSEEGERCSNCECHVSRDDGRCTDDGFYCDDCYSEAYSYCEYYEEDYPSDGFREVRVRRGSSGRWVTQHWSESAFDNHGFTCDNNGNDYSEDFRVTMANGDTWSEEAFEDDGFVCEGDGDNYPTEECIQLEDGTCWSKSHFSEHGITIDGKHYDKDDAPEADEASETAETSDVLEAA